MRPGTVWVEDGGRVQTLPGWRLHARVVLVVHGPSCSDCAQVVRAAGRRAAAWASWGVEALGVREEEAGVDAPFPQVRDPTGRTRRQYGAEADAVVLVLDRRGEVAACWALAHPREPDWEQVDAAVRWVGVQEPECGTCAVEPAWQQLSGEETVWKCT
ncbi:MAG: hypothetical protein ACK45F_02100 [bacterium]